MSTKPDRPDRDPLDPEQIRRELNKEIIPGLLVTRRSVALAVVEAIAAEWAAIMAMPIDSVAAVDAQILEKCRFAKRIGRACTALVKEDA